MGAPYAQDLRDRVLGAYDRGMQTKQISDTFGVSPAWARRTKQVRREQNRMTPLPMGGVRVVKVDLEQLRKLVQQQPDATIAELHQRLGIDCCSESAVGMALVRLGLSFKKRRFTQPSRIDPTLPKNAASGKRTNLRVQPGALSSSTKPGPKRT
jgi:transposase